jgi:TM2 domain-containing membrane protein YozV
MDSINTQNTVSNTTVDELAAAEAELAAAQARLDELKAKANIDQAAQAAQAAQVAQSAQPNYQAQSEPAAPAQPDPSAQANQQPYQQPSYAYTYQQQAYTYQQPTQAPSNQSAYAQPSTYSKDHVAAGLLAIFLGALGIHKFYLGYNTPGFIMLAITVAGSVLTLGLACVVMEIIAIIEGIMYLTKSQTEFEQMYVFSKKEWF